LNGRRRPAPVTSTRSSSDAVDLEPASSSSPPASSSRGGSAIVCVETPRPVQSRKGSVVLERATSRASRGAWMMSFGVARSQARSARVHACVHASSASRTTRPPAPPRGLLARLHGLESQLGRSASGSRGRPPGRLATRRLATPRRGQPSARSRRLGDCLSSLWLSDVHRAKRGSVTEGWVFTNPVTEGKKGGRRRRRRAERRGESGSSALWSVFAQIRRAERSSMPAECG